MTGTGQNTWRYFISMDESHWVKWYWVWLPQTVPQSWFSCCRQHNHNFSLAWSQDTARGVQPCPRMYFPVSKVIHPWEAFLDKSVKERWQLSSSDDFTYFCFQVLIPSALALSITAVCSVITSSGPMWIKLHREPHKYCQVNFLGVNW